MSEADKFYSSAPGETSASFLFHRSASLDLNTATWLVGDNAVDQITFQNLKRHPDS
jgi:hypothetical protein